jgi:hypothetical protein
VNNELERMLMEEVLAEFEILFQHSPGRTKKSHKRSQAV